MQPLNKKKIEFANTLRGFAALCVVIAHYFYMFWVAPATVANLINAPGITSLPHPTFVKFIQPNIGEPSWGTFGVALFFLISGFVIPFSLQKSKLVKFIISRLLRILPAYFFGFSITLIALLISVKYFNSEWPYTADHILAHYLPVLRSLLNYPTIDGIIWTLEIEMQFYIICAASILLFRRQSIYVFSIPIFLFISSMIGWFFLQKNSPAFNLNTVHWYYMAVNIITFHQFIIFMFIGVAFNYLHNKVISFNKALCITATFFGLFFIILNFGPDKAGAVLISSYAWALFLFSISYAYQDFFKGNIITNFLSSISYPLYIIHGISGYVALRILLENGVSPGISLTTVTIAVLLLSWLLHIWVEQPSQLLGKKLGEKLSTARR